MLRVLTTTAGGEIVLFALVDDHVHIVLLVEPERLPRVQASLTKVLSSRSAVELAAPFLREVATRKHMTTLLGYCLNQFEHHGLADDPATATGSCFPDIVGARRLPGLTLQLGGALPRFRQREAYDVVRLAEKLVPASDADVRGLGPARLANLVAQTFAVGPGFIGRGGELVSTRRVAARLARDVGMRPRDLADALGITAHAANRLARAAVDDADLRAVRLRIALDLAASCRDRGIMVVREPAAPVYRTGPMGPTGPTPDSTEPN